ncbi:TetR/AcrR family transcriptional regulator [Marinitenerispora sediminis]|uniref:TetR family transcriptional regulator n=1 Tax=Marinitenerispora sediminis TaxID=1931232 RepID=A0A368T7P1_9ACTN|nr:TetR/AcrR family transcriptional regulator [Marinitenerispora sediminis]RCV49601.1 TetR family transcriptional regulator [Marinitenerispora sediminis]RCV53057.1 TetR family transcriptional regulator [Marinitenerispora sediminis]RCV59802.1 TetR family transcriptional regulator [Marinitenerispora sediminis]
MARTKDPAVRTLLIERAAHMLRAREPITLRSLVAGTGVSTMAVYTYFGGMDGMWRALRQEGFTHLAARFASVPESEDPVRDLTALVAAYLGNALDHPHLYRVMFDANFELEDLTAADATLEYMVQAARRGRDTGRFRPATVPLELATQSWAVAHGVVSLVAGGPLPHETLDYCAPMLTALFVSMGDEPGRCRRSVADGWAQLHPPVG